MGDKAGVAMSFLPGQWVKVTASPEEDPFITGLVGRVVRSDASWTVVRFRGSPNWAADLWTCWLRPLSEAEVALEVL